MELDGWPVTRRFLEGSDADTISGGFDAAILADASGQTRITETLLPALSGHILPSDAFADPSALSVFSHAAAHAVQNSCMYACDRGENDLQKILSSLPHWVTVQVFACIASTPWNAPHFMGCYWMSDVSVEWGLSTSILVELVARNVAPSSHHHFFDDRMLRDGLTPVATHAVEERLRCALNIDQCHGAAWVALVAFQRGPEREAPGLAASIVPELVRLIRASKRLRSVPWPDVWRILVHETMDILSCQPQSRVRVCMHDALVLEVVLCCDSPRVLASARSLMRHLERPAMLLLCCASNSTVGATAARMLQRWVSACAQAASVSELHALRHTMHLRDEDIQRAWDGMCKHMRLLPQQLVHCPITMDLIFDPVRCNDNVTYERTALLRWLERGNATSPCTREPIVSMHVDTDLLLRTDRLIEAGRAGSRMSSAGTPPPLPRVAFWRALRGAFATCGADL